MFLYIAIYIYNIYMYIYTIYQDLSRNVIVRLRHPRSGYSQGQKTFSSPSAEFTLVKFKTRGLVLYISNRLSKLMFID